MRRAKAKAREADRVLRDLGYKFESEEFAADSLRRLERLGAPEDVQRAWSADCAPAGERSPLRSGSPDGAARRMEAVGGSDASLPAASIPENDESEAA